MAHLQVPTGTGKPTLLREARIVEASPGMDTDGSVSHFEFRRVNESRVEAWSAGMPLRRATFA